MATLDFDSLPVSTEYGNKKTGNTIFNSRKLGLNYKDTMTILNTKMVGKEEKRNWFYRQNRIYYEEKVNDSKTE